MTAPTFVVLGTKHVPDTNNTEIRVGTPDIKEITVTVPDTMVGSALVEEVIRRAISVRTESTDALRPVDE